MVCDCGCDVLPRCNDNTSSRPSVSSNRSLSRWITLLHTHLSVPGNYHLTGTLRCRNDDSLSAVPTFRGKHDSDEEHRER
jgi:hypothetical protein